MGSLFGRPTRLLGAAALFAAGIAIGVIASPDKGGAPAQATGRPGGGGPPGGGRPGGGFGPPPPAVTIVEASPAKVSRRIDAIGASRSAQSVTLTSEVTGLVTRVAIAPGASVKRGATLVEIDAERERIELQRLRAQFPIAKGNAERFASLAKEDAASALEAENAFNALKTLEADLRAAEFALQQRTITAPFGGVVGLTPLERGDYVRAGDIVATLDDASAVIVEFRAPQEVAAAVRIGQKVSARAPSAADAVDGVISAVDSRIDDASRTLRVEARFENADGALKPGASFAVSTLIEGEPAVAAPGLAVQWDRSGSFVWKLDGTGAAVRAAVTIAQRTDEVALLVGDLKPGEKIIAEGADRVRPGMAFGGGDKPGRGGGAPGSAPK